MTREVEASSTRYWMKVLLAVVVVAMIVVWEQIEGHTLERQIKPMRNEADRLQYENAHLQMQLNQWTTPGHLDMMARKEFSMAPIDPTHIVNLNAK